MYRMMYNKLLILCEFIDSWFITYVLLNFDESLTQFLNEKMWVYCYFFQQYSHD